MNKKEQTENKFESKLDRDKQKISTEIGKKVFATTAVFIGAVIISAKVLPRVSNKLYKLSVTHKNKEKDPDDWGPVIVKKSEVYKTEENKNAN